MKARNLKKWMDAQTDSTAALSDADGAQADAHGSPVELAQLGATEASVEFARDGAPGLVAPARTEERATSAWGREAPAPEFSLPAFNSMYALAGGGLALAAGMAGASGAYSVATAASGGSADGLVQALKVVVYDGLIKDATIYVDRNGDGKYDASEKASRFGGWF